MAKPGKITAMISSTAADLPEHRKQAFDACLRVGVFPIGMEHLPARDGTGIQASLEMVDQADIYIGIYAWRYGWVPDVSGVPNPDNISITEMEFNRALERRQRSPTREFLEQVWSPAERGPYPLLHADARNVLARIERDEGQRDSAIAAATRAYELVWCDGPPYAYHFGLTNAKQLLAELGAPEPKLLLFDASKFEPMSDVDLNPKDEFWVDPDSFTP